MTWEVIEQKDNQYFLKCNECSVPSFWSPDPPEKTHHNCKKDLLKQPSLPKKALNLTFALGRFFSAVARGKKTHLTKKQYYLRLSICDSCKHRTNEGICLACGCGLKGEIFGKAILRTERCPLGKWPLLYKDD